MIQSFETCEITNEAIRQETLERKALNFALDHLEENPYIEILEMLHKMQKRLKYNSQEQPLAKTKTLMHSEFNVILLIDCITSIIYITRNEFGFSFLVHTDNEKKWSVYNIIWIIFLLFCVISH